MKNLERISKQLSGSIEGELSRIAVLFRIFNRYKSEDSIKEKKIRKNYDVTGKKLQDAIGIRVNLYFCDDLDIVIKLIKSLFEFVGEEIDKYNEETFKPTRINLVFKIPSELLDEFHLATIKFPFIENTFEVQIRTILSEGWHEVEHDLRYKCKSDWENHLDLSRILNGLYASLEIGEWSMLKLFDQLAYRNYQDRCWEAMLRNKLRLRFTRQPLNNLLIQYLNENKNIAKLIFRLNRNSMLDRIVESRIYLPITYDNIIYLLNIIFIKDTYITSQTPDIILEELNLAFNSSEK